MILHYDKLGNPLTAQQFLVLIGDEKYCLIKHDRLHHCLVSTVWLGVDYSFDYGERRLVFETMTFPELKEDSDLSLQWRYATEVEARVGHCDALARVQSHLRLRNWNRRWRRV